MNKTFGVIGGDRRQAELARLLAEEGRTVWTSGVAGCPDLPAQAAAADVVILPLPLCREDGILNSETEALPTSALFRRFRPGQLLLAGQVRPAQQLEAENCGLTLVDYFQREELTVANGAATAEAALQVAMEHLDRTLLGMECLVLGFGRIGKLLAYRLHGLGAHVTVTARKSADLAWIRAYGWRALETGRLDGALCDFGRVQHGPLARPGPPAAGAAAEGLPVCGAGLRPGHRPGCCRGAGTAPCMGPLPAGADGARRRGSGHPGHGRLHFKRTR